MNAQSAATHSEVASIRDTVESIWIAIVLAFLLRAFLVEAFVIPTGSMAPRLMGVHRRLRCQSCGR
jgi:signal peptidase I